MLKFYKVFIISIFLSFSLLSKDSLSQDFIPSSVPDFYCPVLSSGYTEYPYFQMGYNDTLKALVVFCNFPLDSGGNYEPPNTVLLQYWPAATADEKPSWADSVICPTTTNVWNRSLKGKGVYDVAFNTEKLNLSSGIYIYRIEMRNNKGLVYSSNKRMVLVK